MSDAARRLPFILGGALAAVVGLLLLGTAALWVVQRGEMLPNTTIAGVDVSGDSPSEAAAKLQAQVDAREADTVTLTFEDESFVVTPDEVGFATDLDATVATAAARGRQGLPGDIAERWRSLRIARNYPLSERFDEAALATRLDEIAETVDREEITGGIEVDPGTLDVEVERSQGAANVRRDELDETVRRSLLAPGAETFELPVDTTDQPISDEDLDRVAAQVEGAVAAPVTLLGAGTSLELEPATIARLIEVEVVDNAGGASPSTLEIQVTPDRIGEVLGDTVQRFDIDPVDATFVTERTPPSRFDRPGSTAYSPVEASVAIEGGSDGTRFEAGRAAAQLAQLFADNAREADLDLEVLEPELPAARAEELRPTHAIGTFTTYYTAGQGRVDNIQRLADIIDGAVLLPGEQFSINGISGPRSCDRGFVEAGTIVQGELVDTCGGGVSQFGTTTFNAAFFAGVQLDEWRAHSWYISRYPMGREATLSYGVLDVKFTNTTDAVIVVRASYTSESVTVTLFGQPRATTVRAVHGEPFDRTEPDTIRREDDEVPCGQEREVQSPAGGFTVDVSRIVELAAGGDNEQRNIRTVYQPQNQIIEFGPPCPSASSGADDSDDDADSGNDEDG